MLLKSPPSTAHESIERLVAPTAIPRTKSKTALIQDHTFSSLREPQLKRTPIRVPGAGPTPKVHQNCSYFAKVFRYGKLKKVTLALQQ